MSGKYLLVRIAENESGCHTNHDAEQHLYAMPADSITRRYWKTRSGHLLCRLTMIIHVAAHLRYTLLWLYFEHGTMMLVIIGVATTWISVDSESTTGIQQKQP